MKRFHYKFRNESWNIVVKSKGIVGNGLQKVF